MVWWPWRRYRDFTDEVASHIDLETDRFVEGGMSRKEARAAALRTFGNPASAKEAFYESGRSLLVDRLRRDFRYAFRTLGKTPAFTITAVLTLGLGIGLTASVFDVAEPLLARSLPVRSPEELVLFRTANPSQPDGGNRVPIELYRGLAARNATLSGVAAFNVKPYGSDLDLVVEGEGSGEGHDRVQVDQATSSYFSLLGVNAEAGRVLIASDEKAGAPLVTVISYRLWQVRFAGSPDAIGKQISLRIPLGGSVDGITIVGVAAAGFYGADVDSDPDLWLCLQSPTEATGSFRARFPGPEVRMMGRAREGRGIEEIQAEVDVLASQLSQGTRAVDETGRPNVRVEPGGRGYSDLRIAFSRPLLSLSAAVLLVLLIVCVNIASLMLARGVSRRREMAIRLALGGRRVGLMGPFLTEGLILACFGGALGLVAAHWGGLALASYLPPESGLIARLGVGTRTLLMVSFVSVLTVIVFAVLPGLMASRTAIGSSLTRPFGFGKGNGSAYTAHKVGVSLQIGFSLLLLVSAGLFVRTLGNLRTADTGFDGDVVEFEIDYLGPRLSDFMETGLTRIEGLPGVESSTYYDTTGVLGGGRENLTVGLSADDPDPAIAAWVRVGWRFFETMGISVIAGRAFEEGEPLSSVVLSEGLADDLFGDENPIGRTLVMGILSTAAELNLDVRVVGVAEDVPHYGLRDESQYAVYIASEVFQIARVRFGVRADRDPSALMPEIRTVIEEFDPDFRIASLRTLADLRESSLAPERFVAQLASFFGLASMVLAGIGTFGVFSYLAACRKAEIGIRMALGAERRVVIGMLMRQTAWVLGLGVALGLLAALAATRLLVGILYGVSPMDPASVGVASLILALASLLAAYLPARRAARNDPMVALRHE